MSNSKEKRSKKHFLNVPFCDVSSTGGCGEEIKESHLNVLAPHDRTVDVPFAQTSVTMEDFKRTLERVLKSTKHKQQN